MSTSADKSASSPTKRKVSNVFVFPGGGAFPQDDATLQRMAAEIHSVIGNPPTPSEKAKATKRVEEPVPAVATVPTEEDAWIANLSTSPAGQKLLDHLSHMEAAPHIKTSSAIEQVSTFRRVFVHALSKRVTAFGLPKKLPKYIAIVNFSGERLMMHSNNANLITYLALGSSGLHLSTLGVQRMLSRAAADENMSVVIYYSLPFQMSYDTAHWECRTLVRDKDKSINDASLVCCCWDAEAREGSLTTAVEAQCPEILEEQLIAFEQNIKAVDLDYVVEQVEGINPALVTDEQQTKLMKLISVLKNERRKMLSDHRQEIEDLKSKHSKDLAEACSVFKTSVDKQKSEDVVIIGKTRELETRVKDLLRSLRDKEVEVQQLKSDIMLNQEMGEKNNIEMEKRLADLVKENETLKTNAKRIESGHGVALRKQEVVHQQMHDEAERKLQKAKEYESMAKEAETRVKAVEEAFEKISNEKAFATSQTDILKKHVSMYRLRLSIQLGRNSALKEMVKDARMKHVHAAEELSSLKRSQSEDDSLVEKLKAANDKVQTLSTELHDLKIQIADTDRSEDVATSTTGVQRNVECASVQTDILRETLQLGELETECVKMKDEIVNLKSELARAKARNVKRNATLSTVIEEQTSTPAPQPIQISGNASQDAVLEGAIQQLQATLNTVTDLARQSKLHEQNARDAWSKLNVYENMNAYHTSYQQQSSSIIPQTQHFGYMHPMPHAHHIHTGMQHGMYGSG